MPYKHPCPWYRKQTGWWMVQLDRQQVKLLEGKKTEKDRRRAEEKLQDILRLRAINPPAEAGEQHTVASIIDLFLRLNASRYSEDTLFQRKLYLQLFAEAQGWRKVNDRDCLPIHVEEWLAEHPEWQSDWTKHQAVSIVQRPFNWAEKKRLIVRNPFRGVEQPTGEPRRPLTDAEFQALLRASSRWAKRQRMKKQYPSDQKRRQRPSSGARFRQLLIFLRFTGARPDEASRLEWSHIDLDKAVIRLAKHKTSKTQKVKKPRIIPLHPVVVKLLIHIKRRGEKGERVFLNHRRTPWNRRTLSTRIRRARAVAGIPSDAKLYGLRHSFGTRSILNGVDIKTLAELMGHSTTRMTEHYLHLAGHQAHLAAAMLQANGRRPGV